MPNDYELDKLIDSLRRPIYSFTLARAGIQTGHNYKNPSMTKSAETRARNARHEIHQMIVEYARKYAE